MVVAMMFPLVIAQVRQAAFHSLWSRRHRAIGVFLTGYVVPWLAFGALVILIQGGLTIDTRASAIVAIVIAAAWQASHCETPRAQQLSSDHAARTARMAGELGLPDVWVAHRHGVRVRVLGIDACVCRQRSQHPDHVRRNDHSDLRSRRRGTALTATVTTSPLGHEAGQTGPQEHH